MRICVLCSVCVCVCVCGVPEEKKTRERSSSDRLPLAADTEGINDLPVICNCFKLVRRKGEKNNNKREKAGRGMSSL